jgi:serine acetyltransferase
MAPSVLSPPSLTNTAGAGGWARTARAGRIAWTIAAIVAVETAVCTVALLPSVAAWFQLLAWTSDASMLRVPLVAAAVVPCYVLFALSLMLCSATATRLTGARTVVDADLCIRDVEWPLLRWVRYMVATHIVRSLAGWLFRGTPIWSAYLRLNGAQLGRRVYVNTLAISDHNLLDFGDGVVLGDDVHLSGHTVEKGVVRTGRVTLGRDVVVGIGAIIDIDVEAGPGCQIGALSFVPKHARLDAHAVYAGIPARRLDPR